MMPRRDLFGRTALVVEGAQVDCYISTSRNVVFAALAKAGHVSREGGGRIRRMANSTWGAHAS